MKTVLIIGTSEVTAMIPLIPHIKKELRVDRVIIDQQNGRTLDACVPILKAKMRRGVVAVLLWAITPYAWARRRVCENGLETTVLAPVQNFSITHIPALMEQLTALAHLSNPQCKVFLVLPAIKDLYAFNKKKLCESLGPQFENLLEMDPELNPIKLRNFAIYAHNRFWDLNSDQYQWTDKRLLRAQYAINNFCLRGRRNGEEMPRHIKYLNGKTLHLNVSIMPDGLHGNTTFMKFFIKAHTGTLLREIHAPWLGQPCPGNNVPWNESPASRLSELSGARLDYSQREEGACGGGEPALEGADVAYFYLPPPVQQPPKNEQRMPRYFSPIEERAMYLETTGNDKLSYSNNTSTQTLVKVWNFSESIPDEFFDFLFKSIDSKADVEKVVEDTHFSDACDMKEVNSKLYTHWYYLVKLTRVSAILVVRKLDNILVGDSTLRVCLINNQEDYPELTPAQEKFISSTFNGVYSHYKPQIIINIRNKLLDVIDFTNYKTEKCSGSCHGDKTNCNFYHSSSDRRRNPLQHAYMQEICTREGSCSRGDSCSSAHNIYEQIFYPTNFQTIICPVHDQNFPITNGFCRFAHKNSPEMFFTDIWEDFVTFGTHNSLLFLFGAIRAIHKLPKKTDVRICFISQSDEFLQTVFKIINEIAYSQYHLKCVNLENYKHGSGTYDVYLGKPSTVYYYSSKIISIEDYGVLIVDNIKSIMEDSVNAEHLLKICLRLGISDGHKSPIINKVFISNTYDPGVTGVVSRFLGIPLLEVKESEIHQLPKLKNYNPNEEFTNTVGAGKIEIVDISSSRSRSRSVSPSRRSKSRRSSTKPLSRRSRSSRSRSWRNRSLSRSRRSISRLRKRSTSRSRHSRSRSKSHNISLSKSLKKRSKSPKSFKAKKRQVSPYSPSEVSRMSRFHDLSTEVSQMSFQSSSLEVDMNVPSVETLGEEMYLKLREERDSLQNSIEEDFEAYKTFPELHPNYEMYYEEFLVDYYKSYGMKTKEEHKEGLWIMLWSQKVKRLKEAELDKKVKELEKEFLRKVQLKDIGKEDEAKAPQTLASTPSDTFSVENSLKLLEELSSDLGVLGPATVAIIKSAREHGATTSKGLSVIIDDEHLVIIKMVIEKLNTLQKTSPASLVPNLIKGVEWTQKLIEVAKNPPKEPGLNLFAIAKASLGKDPGFTLNLIKTALAYEGFPNMGKEEVNQLFLEVCSIHFEIEMQDK